MKRKYFRIRNVFAGAWAAPLLTIGGCVPTDEGQLAEFFGDLLLNALAAFLL